jgi:glycosyltransferase involved in cell wall biosynthesis
MNIIIGVRKMVEVAIPVYKARETLPQTLNSLVSQIRKNFITCLSIDGDGEDYSDIIKEYTARGLHFRVINSDENGGPGMACQRAIDSTQCDYIIFVDADDLLTPTAVETLYTEAKAHDFDILMSSFIKEKYKGNNELYPCDMGIVTWRHGKIYKVKYLRDKNIRFLPDLRINEDSYFNLVAWNCAENKGNISEVTHIWCDNKNSLTRSESDENFFRKTCHLYLYSQVEGLKKIYETLGKYSGELVTKTIINLYSYYMRARFYKMDLSKLDNIISELKKEKWMKQYLLDGKNWIDLLKNTPVGDIYDGETIVFFQEPMNLWISRLLRNG